MQWVRDRFAFSRSNTANSCASNDRFNRNDSSNSNSSTTNSLSDIPSNGMNGYSHHYSPSPHQHGPVNGVSPYIKHKPLHAKLSNKSSTQSGTFTPVSSSPTTNANSTSLRRQRFKQQHQSKLRERRLSRQASSGTSLSTSQEFSTTGSSITANPIVDRLLQFIRENYAKSMDPFLWDIQRKVRLTSFASFRIDSGNLSGLSNFERVGDSKLIKSLDELTKIILASHIMFSDLFADIRFSTKFAKFTMHNKQLRIFIEKCTIYVEISIDHTMTARLKMLRLVSVEGLETRTRGIPFPLNKSIDSFASKTIHNMVNHSEQYTDQIVPLVNQLCDNYFESALRSISLADLFW